MEPHDERTPTDGSAGEPATPTVESAPDGASSPTGESPDDPQVAAALRELDEVADRPLAEHPDAFGRVHARLQQALADIDDA